MATVLRLLLICCALAAGGCAGLPGRNFPRPPPVDIVHQPNAALTQPFAGAARTHGGASGFRLIPSTEELKLLKDRGPPQRRVRILTTSLEATNDPLAEAGYRHYRVPLLESAVELFELRTHPESVRGSGQSAKMTRYGTYSLHAKLLVFDRSAMLLGSMNYDARSRWLNTEVGLIVHSPELAAQSAALPDDDASGERLRRHPATCRCAGPTAAHLEHRGTGSAGQLSRGAGAQRLATIQSTRALALAGGSRAVRRTF